MNAPSTTIRNRCRWCDKAVYRQRGGWRHTVSGRRLCSALSSRTAEPRTETPAPGDPRPQVAGGVPLARPPAGGALKTGPGGTGSGAPPGPAPIAAETAAWETLKRLWPDVADSIRVWLELGDRAVPHPAWWVA